MATPNFEQIKSFSAVTSKLIQSATDDFMALYNPAMTIDEVVELAAQIAERYQELASELGAQWYDLCTRLANIEAEAAELREVDGESIRQRARAAVETAPTNKTVDAVFNYFLHNEIQNSIRATGSANLNRDYERGLVSGKWARVPVGDTCAWCLMLASQGAWYLSKESALGNNGGHYHDGCDCVAVYHADADNIPNYENLLRYKRMYYDAENARVANKNGKQKYDEELQERVDRAKAQHAEREAAKKQKAIERGEEYEENPWTRYNETLIVMRYQNGLK